MFSSPLLVTVATACVHEDTFDGTLAHQGRHLISPCANPQLVHTLNRQQLGCSEVRDEASTGVDGQSSVEAKPC